MEYTIILKGKKYTFSALSWAYRVLKNYSNDVNSVSVNNLKMAKALTAYYLAANEYTNTSHT